jgi:hypothetical protein
MVPSAPLSNTMLAAPVSSTSIFSRASVAMCPLTLATADPTSHCKRSMEWMPWFISAPPPSKAQVPFQSDES